MTHRPRSRPSVQATTASAPGRPAAPASGPPVAAARARSAAGPLVLAAFAVLHLAAGWHPDPRPWGVHALAFLPRPVWLAAGLALAALLHPAVARRVGRSAAQIGARIVAATWMPVGLALVAGVVFTLLRLRAQLLGDGVVWLERISTRGVFHHFEPLATALVRTVAQQFAAPERSAGATSIACGVLYVWSTARLCRCLWPDAETRGVAWLLLVLSPAVLLFFGYVESYPVLLVLQVLVAWTLVLAVRSRLPVVLPAGLAAVAIATHLQALAWLPALVVLPLLRAASGSGRRRAGPAADLVLGLAVAAASVTAALFLMRALGASPRSLWADLRGESALGSIGAEWFFSAAHGLDLANELLLLLGSVLVLALPWLGRRRVGWPPAPDWLAVAALGPGPLFFTLVVRPRIGAGRDWDLYVSVLLPVLLLGVEAWRRATGAAAGRPATPARLEAAGRAVGFAAVVTLAWLGVNLSAPRAAQRLIVLQDERGTFSNFARGYANEALGIYYRDLDPRAGRDAYARAARANPANARYFVNLANTEVRLQNVPAARDAFRRALDLGLADWYVLYNLGLCELRLGDPHAAEALFARLVSEHPDLWQGHMSHGQALLDLGRPSEALPSLERAIAMHPNDAETHYLAGIAWRDLGRFDAAADAWRRTVQLDPQHARARRALHAVGASP